MPSENFVPLYSTDNVYYASDTDRCLTDDIDALQNNVSALSSGKASTAAPNAAIAGTASVPER